MLASRKVAVIFVEDDDCTPRHWPPPLQDPCLATRPEFDRAAVHPYLYCGSLSA